MGTQTRIVCPICVVPTTHIYGNPEVKEIMSCTTNEKILGTDGYQKITNVYKRPYRGNLIKIKPMYLEHVSFTPNHEILVAEKKRTNNSRSKIGNITWKKAQDVISSSGHKFLFDYVIIPKLKTSRKTQFIDLKPFVKSNQYGKNFKSMPDWVKSKLEIDENIARLMGLWVAEGCITTKELLFYFGKHEKQLIDFIQKASKQLGYTSYTVNAKTAVKVAINSRVLPRAFKEWFGTGAANKKLPEFIMNAPTKIIEAFLKGYFEGDGHNSKKYNHISVSSVSKVLIKQVQLLLIKLGKFYSYGMDNRAGDAVILGRKVKIKDLYKLQGYTRKTNRKLILQDDKFYYMPIKLVSIEHYDGFVYNLETEQEIFCVPFITHNCSLSRMESSFIRTDGKGFGTWDEENAIIQIRDAPGGKASNIMVGTGKYRKSPGIGFPIIDTFNLDAAKNMPEYSKHVDKIAEQLLKVVKIFHDSELISDEDLDSIKEVIR